MAPRRPKSTSTGRKKIEIKRIESEEARQVCFSKRRKGLFNKLNELSTMCGSKVAAVVFSPGGKAFSFGHPSVDSVLDRVCTSNSSEAAAVDGGDGDRSLALAELNRQDRELRAQLAAIKARNEAVDKYFAKARAEECQVAAWLDMVTDVSQMADEDLAAFQAALVKVGADVAARCNQVLQEALLFGRPVQGGGRGGGGEFELGGTSASGGMEMAQQQQMMMLEMPPPPPPTGFAAGTEMMHQQMMLEMPPPPPRTWFDAGTEMVQQQMMTLEMPPPTGFSAGTEMMQLQQQQQQMIMAMPPPTGLDAGTEMMQQQQQQMMTAMGFAAGMETVQQQQQHQQQMMMAMPPLPELAAAMETLHQGFGHDFPQ